MSSKEELISEINVIDRINGYLANYPIETVINFLNHDLKEAKKRLQKLRKSEYNKAYRDGTDTQLSRL